MAEGNDSKLTMTVKEGLTQSHKVHHRKEISTEGSE